MRQQQSFGICAMEISYEFSDLELMHNRAPWQSFLDVKKKQTVSKSEKYIKAKMCMFMLVFF